MKVIWLTKEAQEAMRKARKKANSRTLAMLALVEDEFRLEDFMSKFGMDEIQARGWLNYQVKRGTLAKLRGYKIWKKLV